MYTHFLSNSFEVLAEALRVSLLSTPPLEKKWIVFPAKNPPCKDWLIFHWLQRSQEAVTGVEWVTIKEFFSFLKQSQNGFCPSHQKKDLQEDALFFSLLDHFARVKSDPSFQELNDYLAKGDALSSHFLRKEIARLFMRYGVYGESEVRSWKKTPPAKLSWQEKLFVDVLEKEDLTCPVLEEEKVGFSGFSVHLFGFSYLPSAYLDRLFSLAKTVLVSQYQLSFSPFFWQDMLSDRAKTHAPMISSEEETHHRLLANLGGLQKRYYAQLNRYDFASREGYVEPQLIASGKRGETTLLSSIQQSIYQAEQQKEAKAVDDSIHIGAFAASKLREVEGLFDAIQHWKKNDPSLSFADIMVVAPDIVEYVPYIEFVFSNQGIPLHIAEKSAASNSALLQGFLRYLRLIQSSFLLQDVVEFLRLEPVYSCFGLTKEDVDVVSTYLEKAGIVAGKDAQHLMSSGFAINKHLENSACKRTWKSGLQRILWSFLYEGKPDQLLDFATEPLDAISSDCIPIFSRFLEFFSLLEKDADFLEEKKERPLYEWAEFLHSSLDRYYRVSKKGADPLYSEIQSLIEKTQTYRLDALLSFHAYAKFLEERLEKKRLKKTPALSKALFFQSIGDGSFYPVQALGFLGMQEDAFPVKERASSLDLLKSYAPSLQEKSRMQFLEGLLSVEKYLWISYQRLSFSDGKEQPLSSCVQELISHIEDQYGVAEKDLIRKHPAAAYHPQLFEEDSPYPSFSAPFFSAAKAAILGGAKKPTFTFRFPKEIPAMVERASLFQLRSFAKNPVKTYVNASLGVFFDRKEEKNPFEISPLDRFHYKQKAQHLPMQKVLEKAKASERLPPGLFQENAALKLIQEAALCENALSYFGLEKKELQELSKHLVLPMGQKQISLTCSFTSILDKGRGIFIDGEAKKSQMIRMWPVVLAYLCYSDTSSCSIYFTNKGKPKSMAISLKDPAADLLHFIAYYSLGKNHLSPMIPFVAEELLWKDEAAFLQKLEGWQRQKDPYITWLFPFVEENTIFDTTSIWRDWKPYLDSVFSSLKEIF